MSQSLYQKLLEAYSESNLNSITAKIIELYKAKEYDIIREIASKISEFVPFSDEPIHKCFSKLVILYHPDKGAQIRKKIQDLSNSVGDSELLPFSHILKIQDIDKIVVSKTYEIDEVFEPEYAWDRETSGYEYYTEERTYSDSDTNNYEDDIVDNSFFAAVKRKFYGFMDVDLPYYYLEDHEEIEMSGYGIDDLDGVKFCKHVRNLNLSNNYISDISELQHLKELEELYISNNQIGFIDILIACKKLKVIDISMNSIDDISPLFELVHLQYVNIIGNKVDKKQIQYLKDNDVIVIS